MMKKNTWTLLIFLLLGLIVGSIAAHLLSSVEEISFLTKATPLTWQPRANLDVISYDLRITVKISLLSIAGLAASFWIYRRL
ncbi:DUF4321 domain-containing protein [Paenibacillus gansuensis]|uniref:DUF4321 domain-containing protein n=1 Tax=Paenibacillus gansuensis TaxID=306542 RepID=A0ABW5PC71_9BACL